MKFEDLNLNKALFSALSDLQLSQPTVIQAKVFAPIMAGKDIVGIAQTGTGKTFAYLLPILRKWKFTNEPYPQTLIIVPTRELVVQVVEAIEQLTPYMNAKAVGVYGGTNIKTHKALVYQGADIVVGTPGRLMDLMIDGVLKTKALKHLVIDEVDEMLNLGFRTQLKNIIGMLPERRQNLMFSATLIPEVAEVIHLVSEFYTVIEAAPSGAPLENIEQYSYSAPNFNTKANALSWFLKHDVAMAKVLVFANTKKFADALFERIQQDFEEEIGIIHSSKSQNNRFATVQKFEDGTCRILIATDIIARGLDISGITHVFNFGLPDSAEKYIHRIGRTGRVEKKGIAISLIAENEMDYKTQIEKLMNLPIPLNELPEDIELNEALIDLEIVKDIEPFNDRKNKTPQYSGGGAFHEKKDKNKKVNIKLTRAMKMKLKYKKPQRRRSKKK